MQTDNKNKEKMLEIKNLKFFAGGKQILKDINLQAARGEFIGLIGPNGAGKTTLLKCINGINKGSGTVRIGGRDIASMNCREIAARVAMLHQDTTVTFPFSALDIVLTGRYHKLGRLKAESAEDYTIARKCMEYTDTLQYQDRLINTLSGGERQRVLFAKTLAQETDLILLDEPSSSLDIAHEEQIFKYSCQLCRSGKTVIAAVHDLKTAVRFCSRLVLMKEGCVIADGQPDEVITRDNLTRAYGVNALVYKNRITGLTDFYIPGQTPRKGDFCVHVIGGGGSASGVIRLLSERGFTVTAGVFSHGDSDLVAAEVFGIKSLVCRPFSEIDSEMHNQNIRLVESADLTILCDMPFGWQNLKNLEAAAHAKKLVIIEDEDPESRDFTGGKALSLYTGLKENAVVLESARLHEVLP